ncbi:MAG TPA: amino acid permease [Pyrinomonadaceae bacterium]|nr:amino acid permease [Pyrinomonadaceae bacterium]
MEQTTREGLVRGIRRWDLVAVVINGIIGAGIFGLPSKIHSLIGSYSLIAFSVCALVVTLIILCFAEVASRFDATGGPYLYAREAFGSLTGFEVGWLQWLARITAFAANSNLLVEYLGFFWPTAVSEPWRTIIITGVTAALTLINIVGVRNATVFGNFFTIGKLIPLVLFIAVGIFFINYGNYSPALPPGAPALGYATFSTSVLLLIYAFTGFEMAVIPAGEVQNPQRNIPVALLIAIGIVATLYILIQFVSIGTLPGLAGSSKPLADASRSFMGSAGAAIISAGAMVSIVGNLSLLILAGSRIPFAMAEQKQLPRVLSDTHKRFHTPHAAILLTAAIMLALALSGTFIYALTISAIARLLTYAATCAALPRFRSLKEAPPSKFQAPAGVFVAVAALMLAGWLLSNSSLREARDAGIAAALGLLIYFAYRASRRRGVNPIG